MYSLSLEHPDIHFGQYWIYIGPNRDIERSMNELLRS